jgi:hypothetical protein
MTESLGRLYGVDAGTVLLDLRADAGFSYRCHRKEF